MKNKYFFGIIIFSLININNLSNTSLLNENKLYSVKEITHTYENYYRNFNSLDNKIRHLHGDHTCENTSSCMINYTCIENKCVHKTLFPLSINKFFMIIILIFSSSLAMPCGIGGGAIFSSILMFFDNFSPYSAFPISNLMVLFSSVSVYLMRIKLSVNFPEHRFVNYDLVILTSPGIIFGTVIGVNINLILPQLVLSCLMTYNLAIGTLNIYKNYKLLIQNQIDQIEVSIAPKISTKPEKSTFKPIFNYKNIEGNNSGSIKYLKHEATIIEEPDEYTASSRNSNHMIVFDEQNKLENIIPIKPFYSDKVLFYVNKDPHMNKYFNNSLTNNNYSDPKNELEVILTNMEMDNNESARVSEICRYTSPLAHVLIEKLKRLDLLKVELFEENQPIKWGKIRILLELFSLMFVFLLITGTMRIPSVVGFSKCSPSSTFCLILFSFICYYLTFVFWEKIKTENKLSELFHKTLVKKNINKSVLISNMTVDEVNKLILHSFLAGILSGILGIGGGFILSSIFIELKISPRTTISTSNFLLVFSSASVSFQYFLNNQLILDYGITLGLIIMLSTIVGFRFINEKFASSENRPIILYYLFLIMVGCVLTLPISIIRDLKYDLKLDKSVFQIFDICK